MPGRRKRGEARREAVIEELRAVASVLTASASMHRYRTEEKVERTAQEVGEAIDRLTALREQLKLDAG